MINLSPYAVRLLKDASMNQGAPFDFSQGSDGTWGITPYGPCTDPKECVEIKIALEELLEYGFIRELIPDGMRFEVTLAGVKFAQSL